MTQYQDKLQLGLERLKKAGNDPDLLGLALISLHGALEDYFRDWLSSKPYVPHMERTRVLDIKQVQWKELLDLMQQYDNLSNDERSHILRINKLRQGVGHGSPFTGTRTNLENYANYVQRRVAQSCPSTSTKEETSNNFLQRGDDLRLDLKLAFRKAVLGGEELIRISHLETCATCSGLSSRELSEICSTCNSSGRTQLTKTLKVEIPAGVDTGTRLRITGEGDAGLWGSSPGDLYVYLFVDKDPELKRDGVNILSEVAITPQLALSGCKININTLHATGELKIPPGINHGAVLRLKNQGLPELGNPTNRGDHLVTVKVISSNEGDSSKSDTDKVLNVTKTLEHLLQTKYKAQGRGLHEKVSSVESALDLQLVRDLRVIATIRNKVVHELGYNFATERDKFFQITNSAIRRIEDTTVTNSQTYSSYSSNSSAKSKLYSHNRSSSHNGSNRDTFPLLGFVLMVSTFALIHGYGVVRQWKKYGLFWQWIAANLYGTIMSIALLVLTVVINIILTLILHLFFGFSNVQTGLLPVLLGTITISSLFLGFYLAQQAVLSDIILQARWWSLVSLVGVWLSLVLTLFTTTLSSLEFQNNPASIIIAIILCPITSLPIGIMQWFILKQQSNKSIVWILAVMVEWTFLVGSTLILNSASKGNLFIVLIGMFVSTIVGKIITGKALVKLFS